jgi:hypothetical protein
MVVGATQELSVACGVNNERAIATGQGTVWK